MSEYETREDAIKAWVTANADECCSCHLHPPCGFCVEGFSLDIEEFLELHYESQKSQAALRDGLEREIMPEPAEPKDAFVSGSIRRQFRLPSPDY